MKIKIKVTKDILKKSMMCGHDGSNCAIALAVREIAPRAHVTSTVIWWEAIDFEVVYNGLESKLPTKAAGFIHAFDSSLPSIRVEMPELEFEVDFPDALVDQIGIDQVKEILSKSSTLELV